MWAATDEIDQQTRQWLAVSYIKRKRWEANEIAAAVWNMFGEAQSAAQPVQQPVTVEDAQQRRFSRMKLEDLVRETGGSIE